MFDQYLATSVTSVVLLLSTGLLSSAALAGSVVIHNGRPFFPIGIYHYPERLAIEPRLEELSNAGFNTILMPLTTSDSFMDDAASHGIGVIATLGGYMILSSDQDPKKDTLGQQIERLKKHSALLGYEAPDEIAWVDFNRHPGQNREAVLRGYGYIKSLDPDHPIWMNHAPRNTVEYLRSYSEGGDILGTDIYPVPEGIGHSDLDQSLNCVGQYAEKLDEVGQGKPIYMVLQGFGWDDLPGHGESRGEPARQPTWLETRFMAYDAICHDSNGVIYWGMAYSKRDDPIWDHLKRIASELRDLTPTLLDGPFEHLSSPDPPLELHLKTHDGWNYLFVLNRERKKLGVRQIPLPSGWHGGTSRVLFERRSVTPDQGSIYDSFEPYGVHIYTDDPRPDIVAAVDNPQLLSQGRRATLRVKVENQGRAVAPSFNLSLGTLDHEITRLVVGQLAPSSSRVVGIAWTPNATGNISLRVRADPGGGIDEVTHSNDEEIFTLLVGESKPDLRIQDILMENQSSLSVCISNAGLTDSGPFETSLTFGDVNLSDRLIPSLSPGENATSSWLLPPNTTGVVRSQIILDPLDEVDEMLEGNNRESIVLYMADLVESGPALYPRDLSPNAPWVIKYDPVKGRGTIPPDTDACTLVWSINDHEFPYQGPGDSRVVNGTYESVMKKGLDGLWYVVIPNQEARTLSFKFRDHTEWGTNWDDNQGKGWQASHYAELVQSGPVIYPKDLSDYGIWVIEYDPVKGRGTIPPDTDACTLVWSVNGGKYPYSTPPNSHRVNDSCESVMKKGLDGLWYVVIPNQEARTLSFKFRDHTEWGTNWDDNQGKGWRSASSTYVYGPLSEFDRVIQNGTTYGANMSAFAGDLARAWGDYLSGNFSQVLIDINDNVDRAGMVYVRQLLNVTKDGLRELKDMGIDASGDEDLLGRAEIMLDKGLYRGAEFFCQTVLKHVAEEKASIPESSLLCSLLTGLALLGIHKRHG